MHTIKCKVCGCMIRNTEINLWFFVVYILEHDVCALYAKYYICAMISFTNVETNTQAATENDNISFTFC